MASGGERSAEEDRGESLLCTRWLYLRLLGVVWLAAFCSLWLQVDGLYGSEGIQPAAEVLAHRKAALDAAGGVSAALYYLRLPSVFWLNASDLALNAACGAGAIGALLVIANWLPTLGLAVCWALYLSFVSADAAFLTFQWDALLLEAGFLALFLAPVGLRPGFGDREPMWAVVFLHRWLLARVIFWSGAVKLLSGDPVWRDLSALSYHYWTQPLPSWTAWYVNLLPPHLHELSAGAMFAVDLLAPALILFVPRARPWAALAVAGLMGLIAATGNYGFFNLLTAALCVMALRDAGWVRWLPDGLRPPAYRTPPRSWGEQVVVLPLVLLVFAVGAARVGARFAGPEAVPAPVTQAVRWSSGFRLVNSYGLFATMTTSRPEISIQGSLDGQEWRTYSFRWKPGEPTRRPPILPLYMPRLDWRMWFAALSSYERQPWLQAFMQRLLERSPAVLGLLEEDPFGGHPPRYVRAVVAPYTFTDPGQRSGTDAWWVRGEPTLYAPPMSLK